MTHHNEIILPRRGLGHEPWLRKAAYKSDLRNHQAVVQPRLYDCLMARVAQITRLY